MARTYGCIECIFFKKIGFSKRSDLIPKEIFKLFDVHLDANVKVRMTLGTPSRGTNTNFYIDAKQLVHSRKINFEPRILLKFSAAILCQCFCFFWNNN